jgi:uncharacterized protein YndB with AHSA1/START domain
MSAGHSTDENEATAPAAPLPKRVSKLKLILCSLAALAAVLLAVIASQPSACRFARSTTIAAPPAKVFPLVNDFHNWTWNPWSKIDPAMTQTYDGAPAGVGALYGWSGNSEVGEGRMTIVESRPDELVRVRLEFVRPFSGANTAEFTFRPVGDQTTVTWTMTGKNSFLAKAIHLVLDMDQMIGGRFETGLAEMKALAEAVPSDEPGDPAVVENSEGK